jgi:holo-[acyl-carrier protein] synthase
MIYGIGTDVCDIRRIAGALQRRGERFAQRVLGAQELAVFHARHARVAARGVAFLATRFAAKEAFSKAIGLGLRQPMGWRACEIVNTTSSGTAHDS